MEADLKEGEKKKGGSKRGDGAGGSGSKRGKKPSGKRYFKNPWIEAKFKETGPAPADDFRGFLVANIERLHQFEQIGLKTLDKADFSVYTGNAGIALAYIRVAHALSDPQKRVAFAAWEGHNAGAKQQQYLQYAEQRLQAAVEEIGKKDQKSGRLVSFIDGEAGVHAVAALLARLQKKSDVFDHHLKELKSLHASVADTASNEVLYGKAGYLYALLFALKHLKPDDAELTDLAAKTAALLVKEGKEKKFKSVFPLMYEWHDSKYLGAAHGLTGILYMLLQHAPTLADKDVVADIQACIDKLMSFELSDGNYPTREDSEGESKLVQWCHGAPASVLLYVKAFELWKNDKWLQAAKRAGECVWRLGLLKKGLGLCHGMGGNGYVFLRLFAATNEYHWYQKALYFCEFSWSKKGTGTLQTPDEPYSLFGGMAGMMCLMADCLHPAAAAFPAYDV